MTHTFHWSSFGLIWLGLAAAAGQATLSTWLEHRGHSIWSIIVFIGPFLLLLTILFGYAV